MLFGGLCLLNSVSFSYICLVVGGGCSMVGLRKRVGFWRGYRFYLSFVAVSCFGNFVFRF